MKRQAIVIGFGATLATSCLAQQTSWKAEHHDGLLVAPHTTAQIKAAPSKIDFGAVKLTSISPPRVLTYTFRERTEIQDIRVETSGQEQLDFANAGTGSCRSSAVYRADIPAPWI